MNYIESHIEGYIHTEGKLFDKLGVLKYSREAKAAMLLEEDLKDRSVTLQSLYAANVRGLIEELNRIRTKLLETEEGVDTRELKLRSGIINDMELSNKLHNPKNDEDIVGGVRDIISYVLGVSEEPLRKDIVSMMSNATVSNANDLYDNLESIKDYIKSSHNAKNMIETEKGKVHFTDSFIGNRHFGFVTDTSTKSVGEVELIKRLTLVGSEVELPKPESKGYVHYLPRAEWQDTVKEIITRLNGFVAYLNRNISRELVFSNIEKHMPTSRVTGNPIFLDEGRTLLSSKEGKALGLTDAQRYELGIYYTQIRLVPICSLYNFSEVVNTFKDVSGYLLSHKKK